MRELARAKDHGIALTHVDSRFTYPDECLYFLHRSESGAAIWRPLHQIALARRPCRCLQAPGWARQSDARTISSGYSCGGWRESCRRSFPPRTRSSASFIPEPSLSWC